MKQIARRLRDLRVDFEHTMQDRTWALHVPLSAYADTIRKDYIAPMRRYERLARKAQLNTETLVESEILCQAAKDLLDKIHIMSYTYEDKRFYGRWLMRRALRKLF